MWERLVAVKRHREDRLRTEINSIDGKIRSLHEQIEHLDRERAEVIEVWRQRSEEQSVYKEDKLKELRRELSGYHTKAEKLQAERAQQQDEIRRLERQRGELNDALRQCIAKQEKLQLLQKEQDEHRPNPRY